jgi:hypothetical protein
MNTVSAIDTPVTTTRKQGRHDNEVGGEQKHSIVSDPYLETVAAIALTPTRLHSLPASCCKREHSAHSPGGP